MTENYDKFGYGLFILKSKNSLFNADFSHEPRQLPDSEGTFYATDKSLKYCIRKYVHDIKGEKQIFFWRRNNSDKELKPMDLGENYKYLFEEEPPKKDNNKAETKLLSCWDVRIFGATFAESDCNLSITGPIQISYGINKTVENQKYSSQILSPFRDSTEKKKEAKARTLGNESKALEAHLAFDYVINPKTLREPKLTNRDVEWFKEAICKGVSYVNSSAKIGSESEFMLYLESDQHNVLPLLKDFVDVNIKDGKNIVNLSRISDLIKRYEIKHIEIYYEPACVEISGKPDGAKTFNIYTMKPL